MTGVRVKMLCDGFVEGRRARKGAELFVYQPHLVSFRSMELFDERDIVRVEKAKEARLKDRKDLKKRTAATKPKPKLVSESVTPVFSETVRIDPETGIPVNVSSEVGADGKPADLTLPGQPAVPVTPNDSVI